MNCTRCEVCAAAVSVYAPMSFVHLSLLFRLLLEPICTLGIILLTIAVYQTKTLHYNARLLLMCMTISVMVCNIGECFPGKVAILRLVLDLQGIKQIQGRKVFRGLRFDFITVVGAVL